VACYVLAYEFNLEYDVVAQSILFTTILYFFFYPFYSALISLLF
jgi:predicted permease